MKVPIANEPAGIEMEFLFEGGAIDGTFASNMPALEGCGALHGVRAERPFDRAEAGAMSLRARCWSMFGAVDERAECTRDLRDPSPVEVAPGVKLGSNQVWYRAEPDPSALGHFKVALFVAPSVPLDADAARRLVDGVAGWWLVGKRIEVVGVEALPSALVHAQAKARAAGIFSLRELRPLLDRTPWKVRPQE